jgi:hypothetical protein
MVQAFRSSISQFSVLFPFSCCNLQVVVTVPLTLPTIWHYKPDAPQAATSAYQYPQENTAMENHANATNIVEQAIVQKKRRWKGDPVLRNLHQPTAARRCGRNTTKQASQNRRRIHVKKVFLDPILIYRR